MIHTYIMQIFLYHFGTHFNAILHDRSFLTIAIDEIRQQDPENKTTNGNLSQRSSRRDEDGSS